MASPRRMSSEMRERLSASSSGHCGRAKQVQPPPLTGLDDSDAVPVESSQALMKLQPIELHKDIVLVTLLKGWCEANGKSSSKSQRLFRRMVQKLKELKLLIPGNVEALKRCESQYSVLLQTLVSLSLSNSSEDSTDGSSAKAVVPYNPFSAVLYPPERDHSLLFPQRYSNEFDQKKTIGKGGFGKVYEVTHKLDGKDYAIKKIKVTEKKSQAILREIQTLASLGHPNVVRYHQAWFGEEVHKRSRQHQKFALMLEGASHHHTPKSDGDPHEDHDYDDDDEDDYSDHDDSSDENSMEFQDYSSTQKDPDQSLDGRGIGPNTIKTCTSPVITEVDVVTESNIRSVHATKKVTITAPPQDGGVSFDDFTVSFEEERFDSTEMVTQFFKETSENTVMSYKTLTTDEESSSSTVIFQHPDQGENNVGEFHIPSLSERGDCTDTNHNTCSRGIPTERSSGSRSVPSKKGRPKNGKQRTPPKGSAKNQKNGLATPKPPPDYDELDAHYTAASPPSYEGEIDATATASKRNNIINNAFVYTTNGRMPIPQTLLTASSSGHPMKLLPNPMNNSVGLKNRKCFRSISWDGQESSPETSGYSWTRISSLHYERRLYLYIQMELCSTTLSQWLKERNEGIKDDQNQFDAVRTEENVAISKQILEGLNYIHNKGILHRDMTPKNIFLSCEAGSSRHHVKIGDFGLAREDSVSEPKTPLRSKRPQKDPCDLDCSAESCDSTCDYTSGVGTTTYAAPEQLDGTTYDNKSDMYSIGLILFEMYHPFKTGMERGICLRELRGGSIPVDIKERWPPQCSAIQELTRQNSDERPSASDLLQGQLFPSKDEVIAHQAKEIARKDDKIINQEEKIASLEEQLRRLEDQLRKQGANVT